jgi:hypothetical protein
MKGVTPLWQVPDLNEKPYPKVTFFIQITLFVTFERYFEKFPTDTICIYHYISISYIRPAIIHLVGKKIAL